MFIPTSKVLFNKGILTQHVMSAQVDDTVQRASFLTLLRDCWTSRGQSVTKISKPFIYFISKAYNAYTIPLAIFSSNFQSFRVVFNSHMYSIWWQHQHKQNQLASRLDRAWRQPHWGGITSCPRRHSPLV